MSHCLGERSGTQQPESNKIYRMRDGLACPALAKESFRIGLHWWWRSITVSARVVGEKFQIS